MKSALPAALFLLVTRSALLLAQEPLPLPVPMPETAAAAETPTWRPAVGQPAPEPGLAVWTDDVASKDGTKKLEQIVRSGGDFPTSRKAKTLAELADHVVIVHTFAWGDGPSMGRALPLIRDLLAANSDRRLAAIGICDFVELETARGNAKSLFLDHPIAIEKFEASHSPFVDSKIHPPCWAFVVGRGGGLRWQGDPARDEKAFLAAVADALDVPEVAKLERPLHEKLAKALTEYYAGKLSRALSLAADEREAAQKSPDKAGLEDAQLLEKAAHEAQLTWLRELENAAAKKDSTAYVALVRACKLGFAKGDVAKDLERLDKEAHKDGFFEMRLIDSQKYFEMFQDRPILFPARKEAAGEKFAKKLESFVRSTSNSTEETRTEKALADRYRLTAR